MLLVTQQHDLANVEGKGAMKRICNGKTDLHFGSALVTVSIWALVSLSLFVLLNL